MIESYLLPHNTYGGGIDPQAVIGYPPQHRDWDPSKPVFAPEIHPTARVEALAVIDAGYLGPTVIGARSWVMKLAHVGHDVVIGEDCELPTGVIIGGHCTIGDRVRFGIGVCVRPFITIGDGARIGCGAVVVKDVPPGVVVAGNPARPLPVREPDYSSL